MIPPIADRFVAGEDAASVLEHTRELNRDGIGGILNLLGEHYTERAPADGDTLAYHALIEDVADAGLDACVSVKPSQLGLVVGADVFEENLATVVDKGARNGVFVWVDMEDHTTVDATLDAVVAALEERGGGVGVCLQANLRRTRSDLERLASLPGKVRLVKGAYNPPRELSYRDRDRVDRAYREYLRFMFEEFEGGIAVGSHDPAMIDAATALHEELGTPFEIQMLMGVREAAQRELAAEYETYQYVPYGGKWLSYFYRRVVERKENVLFALRAIVKG